MPKLTIPARLPGLNEYIEAERIHRQRAAKMKREYTELVAYCARSQLRGYHPTRPVVMNYRWIEANKKRDKDNVSSFGRKVIQDGLVQAGVLKNDGWANIERFSDTFAVDPQNPRVEIEIEEVQDDG